MKEEVILFKRNTLMQTVALKSDIANLKSALIKWMFIFWIGQMAATFGFIILYLKK